MWETRKISIKIKRIFIFIIRNISGTYEGKMAGKHFKLTGHDVGKRVRRDLHIAYRGVLILEPEVGAILRRKYW